MAYTFTQLEDLWVQAGGSRLYAPIAAAIAMAESGGNPNAINSNNKNGSTDRGLWQINSIHGSQSTFDPVANARAAVGISKGGTDWRPWCVAWSNGACGGTFLGAGAPVLKFIPGTVPSGSVPTAGTSNSTITGIGSAYTDFASNLTKLLFGDLAENAASGILAELGKFAFRIACVILGLVLIPIGVVFLILSTRTAQSIGRRYLTGPEPATDVNIVGGLEGFLPAPPAAIEASAPVSAIPVTPADPYIDATAEIPVVKKPPYKPRHYMKVKKDTKRTVIPKRGDSPDDWPTTKGYVPKH